MYWLCVIFLDKKGVLKKYNITAHGPLLMLRTQKGQVFLDNLSIHKRFWRTFANIGIPAMLIGMAAMFLMIMFVDYSLISSFQTHTVPLPGKFNEPRNIFLIPGLNEYIPLEWGIIALIVTLVVHEFSHAILCKVEGIKVKSMGLLVALIPIGGFAEPDEEQLLGKKEEKSETQIQTEPKKLATRSERVRVLAAGVMANFVVALIAFSLFFTLLSSLSPVGDIMVTGVVAGSPAEQAGIKQNMILIGIDDTEIKNAQDLLIYTKKLEPGTNISLNLIESGVRKRFDLETVSANDTSGGVKVYSVVEKSPAQAAGIKPDMILVRIDDTEIKEVSDFISFMNTTEAGQTLRIELLSNSSLNASLLTFNILLEKYPYQNDVKKGFIGISYAPDESAIIHSIGLSIGQFPAKTYLHTLKSIPSMLISFEGWLLLFGLPIYGLSGEGFSGFSGLISNFYEPTGWAIGLGAGLFWILNTLMWIGWMNFYCGLFNCLPAVPLDGGHVFRDVMSSTLVRIFGDGEKVEKFSNSITVLFALLILMSFVFVMIAPYAAHGY
ncbi:MAG: site-2 protease family protein [Candidatus Methanoperedens sp.]|nr:site-2 protease family protein [Candidatus Methanoperedens sp.]MCE8425118.1 site-2 protease family protein [Candidatus Methanoperedens sp.]MCE8428313.1 site-2 protease family protein [Candidatus Methanoperedens sp.]